MTMPLLGRNRRHHRRAVDTGQGSSAGCRDSAINAPVLPALTHACARPSRTSSSATRISPACHARPGRGRSSEPITSLAACTQALPVERRIAGKEFFEEGRLTDEDQLRRGILGQEGNRRPEQRSGDRSPPPIASIAMIGADKDYSSEPLSTTLRPR